LVVIPVEFAVSVGVGVRNALRNNNKGHVWMWLSV
jgi:hypothetical protein